MAKERKKPDKREAAQAKARKSAKRARDAPSPDNQPAGPGGFGTDDRPAVAITVDVVVLALHESRPCVLLVERRRKPDRGSWALPGTVVDPDEGLTTAAARAVAARTGVSVTSDRLEQLAAFGDPDRDPRTRVVSIGFLAVADRATPPAGGEVASGRWWPLDEVMAKRGPALAFDHRDILASGMDHIRADLEWSDLATYMLEEPFTLGDLRRAYEAVWGTLLEPANFRRKILATPGFVDPPGELRKVTTGRPAELYERGAGVRLHPPLLRPG